MHRIDTPTAQADKFGVGKNGFTGGNPQTGELPTALDADFFDSVQEEISAVIEGAGKVLSKEDNSQLFSAISLMLNQRLKTQNYLSEIKAAGANSAAAALGNLNIASVINASNGYLSIPLMVAGTLRNIIIQFGQGNVASSSGAVSYPIAFPTKVIALVATKYSNTQRYISLIQDSLNSFSVYGWNVTAGSSNPDNFGWIAVGY